jgi:uncharacterized phosphosugar-binding protein
MDSFSQTYFETVMAGAEGVRNAMPRLIEAAETIASKLVAGGDLYIASVRPDFTSEGYIRSGGLMMLKEYKANQDLSAKDVVMVGWTETERDMTGDLVKGLQKAGAFTLGIGPVSGTLSEQVDIFLESTVLLPASVAETFDHMDYPFISLQNLILLWTFTGELVAALTRSGQMPAMFQSVLVPGARQRNADIGTRRFHKNHTVSPLPPGFIGCTYLDKIKSCFHTLCDQEINAIAQAATACVTVLNKGFCIHAFLISHFPIHQAGAPGDPKFMRPLEVHTGETPDEAELENKLQSGDLFFFLGYYRRPKRAYEIARNHNCQIVEIITGTDAPARDGMEPDYVIHPGWYYTDSLVPVPGYDVPILPASGILQSAIYWAVTGEMAMLSDL